MFKTSPLLYLEILVYFFWPAVMYILELCNGSQQRIIHTEVSLADASILCTALGGDHNKDPRLTGCGFTDFVIYSILLE